jgi:trimeric autotransporter adhesin
MKSSSFPFVNLTIAAAIFAGSAQSALAATCPFDGGGSDAINDGLVLTRYALDIRGAPMTASTRYASLDPLQVKNNIECVGCALDMNGDGQIDTVDATIIARHLAGFKDTALTNGLTLGSGSRPNTVAITSFLTSGCAVGGAINAFTQGGNAFGAPAVIGTTDGFPVTLGVGGGHGVRVQPSTIANLVNVVAGSADNAVGSGVRGATIGGGGYTAGASDPHPTIAFYATSGGNRVDAPYGTVAGGIGNTAGVAATNSLFATVSGGLGNRAQGYASAVAGGDVNFSIGTWSSVGGGFANQATGGSATVPGGESNHAANTGATALGGSNNLASGIRSVTVGGQSNLASGALSVAIGNQARAMHDYSFVLGGNTNGPTDSSGPSTFTAFAQNGYYLYGGTTAGKACIYVPDNNNGWQCTSNRNAKTNIVELDGKSVLAKVAAMPVASWSFIGGEAFRQIGPMAQDFFAAFKLGNDEKSISPMNMSGVALAAIQGLNQLVKEKDGEIAALKARLKVIEKKLGM